MTNLELLDLACQMVRIQRPLALTSLTREQDTLLRMLDEEQALICSMKDWYFRQGESFVHLLPVVTGSDAFVTTTGGLYYVETTSSNPFYSNIDSHMTLTGGSGWSYQQGGTRDADVFKVRRTGSNKAKILGSWNRGTHAAANLTYRMCSGEYYIGGARVFDRIAMAFVSNYSTAMQVRFLSQVSIDELEAIRCARTNYLETGQPCFYAVKRDYDGTRIISVDPFPDVDSNMYVYGINQPTSLWSASSVTVAIPDKWAMPMLYGAFNKYTAAYGLGASGQLQGGEASQRVQDIGNRYLEMIQEMRAEPRIGQEQTRMDPMSQTRGFYQDQLGRSF